MPLIFIKTNVAPVGFIQILPRPDGDNTRRVNGFVAAEIVGADMVKIDRFGNSGIW